MCVVREIPYDPYDEGDDRQRKQFPRVTFKTPRGNVLWRHGDRQYIHWLCTASGVGYMKLEVR